MFTLGSMSHHNTHEGTDSSRSLTLTSAAIAAVLARAYYFKAIAGVAGMSCGKVLHSLYSALQSTCLTRPMSTLQEVVPL